MLQAFLIPSSDAVEGFGIAARGRGDESSVRKLL